MRDGAGFDDVSTLVSDHHGTAGLSITNVSAEVSYRYTTPFGDTRGSTPTAWTGDHGFLDKPTDATGLTAIGARYYDAVLGRFISVDPVMDLTDPQQWAAYTYGNHNPATWSDPTGLLPIFNTIPGAGGGGKPHFNTPTGQYVRPPAPEPEPETVDPPVTNTTTTTPSTTPDEPSVLEQVETWVRDFEHEHPFLSGVLGVSDALGCLADGEWQSCAWLLANFIPAGKLAKLGKTAFEAADVAIAASRSADEVLDGATALCRRNSFDAGTLVLMADGTRRAIEDVGLGDEVIATDPETGEQGPREVIDLIRHGGLHTMVDVELADGSQVDATSEHPFWVASDSKWVDAIDLEPGDQLRTQAGTTVTIADIDVTRVDLTAYNLTIAGIHTYHVGTDEVLVHNCGPARNKKGQFTSGENADAARGRKTHSNYRNALGPGYRTEDKLPSGRRPDAIDWTNRVVRELKSDAASSQATGRRQLQGYVDELESTTGQSWTGYLDTYRRFG
ncbi:polymorphic toxin-type HINT domain-containing protein [Isoptericola aurantiacus]|uniref:polymorphic toxin-type HINT domain-containing protein n=1 Tax=Isoptericola aurantiacus TaxID=3377839 RepID=UPI003839DBD7